MFNGKEWIEITSMFDGPEGKEVILIYTPEKIDVKAFNDSGWMDGNVYKRY